MDADLKKRWVKALRSGKYEQGRERLRQTGDARKHAYCCIGVLCNIVDRRGWLDDDEQPHKLANDCEEMSPPNRERAGLSGEEQAALINMNDNGASFVEIADYIEQNL
jgi:hypothetical protein